jgi:putative ABC transport system permease protein
VVALLAGLLVGLLAALRYGKPALVQGLKEGGRGGTVGRERLRARNALVVVQVALALVLLVGAGLIVKSFWRLRQVDPGINPHNVLTVRLDLPETEYQSAAATTSFVVALLEKVRAIPGVQAAGTVTVLPLTGGGPGSGHRLEDLPLTPGTVPPVLSSRWVSPGYFETLRIPVLQGRVFDRLDPTEVGREAVVSEATARRLWPGQSPLGKRLAPDLGEPPPWYTVVGVVGNVSDAARQEAPVEAVYYPMQRKPGTEASAPSVPRSFTLLVRATSGPLALVGQVRRAVWSLNPHVPLSNVRTMEEVAARSMVRTTFTMLLLVIAAMMALLLGAVGIYGVVSYVVSQRTREIGVRMALGAARRDIARLVLQEGLGLSLTGIAIGVLGALVLTRLMVVLLFNVSPTDPTTFAGVSVLLALIALLACYLPARRAASVQPLEAIRYE